MTGRLTFSKIMSHSKLISGSLSGSIYLIISGFRNISLVFAALLRTPSGFTEMNTFG